MQNYLLLTIVFCFFFATAQSIRCYEGTTNDCALGLDKVDCGPNDQCMCAKFRFKCIEGDRGCTELEQQQGVFKWMYTVLTENLCDALKDPLAGVHDLQCCNTDRCNRSQDGGCLESLNRRRALQKLLQRLDA